ncbi:MAG: DUF6526 family protein [Puia sp.]|nr:DUF6526 family protein [Puia sp.]
MKPQNYQNHKRYVYLYHGVTLLAILALCIGSLVNLSSSSHENLYSASLLVLVSFIQLSLFCYARIFPLRAQDRAIRAEENLRHFAMTGQVLDKELTIKQIVALRFASDEEFVRLARRAVDEALNSDEIKKEIKNWKMDAARV